MGFDTINKLFLVYDYPWWSEDLKGIQLIWDDVEKSDPGHQVTINTHLTCESANLCISSAKGGNTGKSNMVGDSWTLDDQCPVRDHAGWVNLELM